ncbi:MAG: hypothetical protein JSW07_03305 [bacterium]|nr:MAG: hypothetical protein JSW07_03305 [bacterium]
MSKISISQEVEGYCGKCKTDTLHIITAIDDDKIEKVMCKVCMSYHKYKKPIDSSVETLTKKTQKKPVKKVKKRTRRDKWTRLLEGLNSNDTIEYKMDKEYELETAIHHEIFGIGVVKNIIDSRKIGVLFHDGEKILVQNLPPRSQ